jgi:putative acetyltransferase
LRIRPAESADTPGIHGLISEVYAEYDCILDVERDEPHLIDPGPYFRARGGQFWVLEGADRILATGAVLLHPDSAELKTLYVHPSIRRQGWARQMIERSIDHARAADRTRMVLWTDTRFRDAHRLYESLGFQQTGYRVLNDLNSSREYRCERELGSREQIGGDV